MQESSSPVNQLPVLRLFLVGFGLLLLTKLFLAAVLDLYSDEVFYWQASTQPALAYSDLPFMTALLIGMGSALEPGSTLAARSLFILMGCCLPFLVYWVAVPVTNRRQAWESAALVLCLPLGGFLGLLAVPDVPLLFFGLLAIGLFERSLRINQLKYWILMGIAVALGLSTHYRFFLYPAAAILFLCWFEPERKQWRNPKLWIAMAIASIGLIPIAWFNLSNQLSSASFYFLDRHPWEFQASGLLHAFKQAGLVTPPLYLVFVLTVILLYRQASQGQRSAALFMSFALVNILVYLLLAPWTDATSTSIHWPLSGYFPLLIFVPATLRSIHSYLAQRWTTSTASKLVASVPLVGFIGTLVALLGVGSQALQPQLQPLLGSGVLSNKMAGWKQFAQRTTEVLSNDFEDTLPVIITDNYYTAAQLEFADLSSASYTLDQDKAVRDGRIAQYQIWRRDESGLPQLAGRQALFITEDSTLDVPTKHDVLERACHHTDSLELVDELSLFSGDKHFSFYKAQRIIDRSSSPDSRSSPCPFPPRAWIDFPEAGDGLSGAMDVRGWAYNEDIGVAAVRLLLDDSLIGAADYGINRPDVVDAMQVKTDPNAPRLGFSYQLNTLNQPNGEHRLAIEIVDRQGRVTSYGERSITIIN